jgi:hypothetical protein
VTTTDPTVPPGAPEGAATSSMTLADAASVARTGDIWLFRGRSGADRAIRVATNSPVNHVGMVLAFADLPPLLFHAELGRSLPDVWTGEHHRGTQLHRLVDAVQVWQHKYGQHAWVRQIDREVARDEEDAAIQAVDELVGRAFPKPATLAKGWVMGRARRPASVEVLFCAEVVAITLERMGMLSGARPPNWYDPGKFWSGDHLQLIGAALDGEIAITAVGEPPPHTRMDGAAAGESRTAGDAEHDTHGLAAAEVRADGRVRRLGRRFARRT